MGIRTIAVYSEADAGALFVREADEAVLIGPPPARESYLLQDNVLAAARQTGAEAIHPGYGFLSENADFARAVIGSGMSWIGAPPEAIEAMGLKDAAKQLMLGAGVPVTPGYMGPDQSAERLKHEADTIGYPVLIKAVAGGGGKGMRKVETSKAFLEALASCKREAASSFGDDRVLLEKYILSPRHIEVQVFGDHHGTVVHLNERDCSLQRRHQKVIEEAPAPGMDGATREAITQAAVKAALAVNYVGAGTIEFIADASEGLRADRIWFMEMNTRLQVEHPVTEAITGVDLVEWQFRAAAGEPVPLKQADIPLNGWAMEARLYAEDPANGFLPSIGKLEHLYLPDDIRVDTGVESGGEVSQFYDPMIAKLIVHASSRTEAAARLASACGEVEIWPVKTNAGFLKRCLEHPRFVSGDVDTGFIASEEASLAATNRDDQSVAAALAWRAGTFAQAACTDDVWGPSPDHLFGFRLNADPRPAVIPLVRNGVRHTASIGRIDAGADWELEYRLDDRIVEPSGLEREAYWPMVHGDGPIRIFKDGEVDLFDFSPTFGSGPAGSASDGSLRAPMPGKIVLTPAGVGDDVVRGQAIVVLEAMKMEHALCAPFDGVLTELNVQLGGQVSADVVLAVIKAKTD
jgi:acetyl/propionyl-CoA carboxylase alpha subunit